MSPMTVQFTTLSLRPETLRRLRVYKVEGRSWDDVMNEFMVNQPPQRFVKEWLRRLREEPDLDWREVKRRLKL